MSIELRAPTPLLVGIAAPCTEPGDPVLSEAIDLFFATLAARFPSTEIVLLIGPGEAGFLGASRARAHAIPYVAVLPSGSHGAPLETVPSAQPELRELLAGSAGFIELARDETLVGYLNRHCAVLMNPRGGPPSHGEAAVAEETAPLEAMVYTPVRQETDAASDSPMWPTLVTIERWNARAAGCYYFDGTLCRQTFDIADRLALKHQRYTLVAIDWVYWLTLATTVSLQSYDHLGQFLPATSHIAQLFALTFFGSIFAAVALTARIHRSEVQNLFQDYRLLAEGLRVQSALLDEGLDIEAARRYANVDVADLTWIRRAIDATYVAAKVRTSRSPSVRREDHAGWTWIADQRAYYEGASERNRTHALRANRIAIRWLRLSVATAVLIAIDGLAHFIGLARFGRFDFLSKVALLTTFALSGTFAGIVKGKSGLRAYAALASRYRKMFETFDAANRGERTPDTLLEVADAALAESAAWHSSERSRPLESMWGGRATVRR